ncbi:MAG: hypothetical protein FJX76_19125, partial [Armatimonadetes bacterium]|nr:hypothetical protein [Armatimonadota bacterium]
MATGIQTGIRTGSAPMPAGKGPGGGGLGKVFASWTAMSTKMKVLVVVGLLALVGAGVIGMAVTQSNKHVPLYATNLSPADVTEITRRLNESGVAFTMEGSKIMVHPGIRTRTVGLLLGYGLPHRVLTSPSEAGGMTPKTEFEKRQASTAQLENDLVDQIRQFEIVADAYVKLVPLNEDALPGDQKDAKASVYLALKPGSRPNRTQIEAILNLVAFSVPGLQPENVKVTDRTGFVWNDGAKIAAAPGGGTGDDTFENENLAIKKAYEKRYQDKIQSALNTILGQDNYTVTVDADIDFTQTKVETTQVGEPGGNNSVVTVVKKDRETYKNQPGDGKPDKPGTSQVSMLGSSDKTSDTDYEKIKYEQKIETGKVVKTAIISPGVVKKVTTTVSVNGKKTDEEKTKLAQVAAAAIGLDTSRGDSVAVVDIPYNMNPSGAAAMANLPEGFGNRPQRDGLQMNPTYVLAAMVVPTMLLLGVLA